MLTNNLLLICDSIVMHVCLHDPSMLRIQCTRICTPCCASHTEEVIFATFQQGTQRCMFQNHSFMHALIVPMHACMDVCKHACVHARMQACTHPSMRVHARTHASTRASTHTNAHVCTHAHKYACTHIQTGTPAGTRARTHGRTLTTCVCAGRIWLCPSHVHLT